MRKQLFTLLIVALAVTMVYSTAFAGAFRIPEAGTPAMGQANAFVGQADDPSAVHHNAAGIVNLEGTQIMSGMNVIKPESEFTLSSSGVSSDAVKETFYVPYIFYTNHIQESDWWIGFGVNAPFGLGTEWDDSATFNSALEDLLGAGYAGVPLITKTSLEIVKIAPMAAYKVNDQFSVGFGPEYYKVQEIIYNGGAGTGSYQVIGDGHGLGFGLSGLYQATDALRVGLSYHSGVTADVSVDAIRFPLTASTSHTGPATVDLNLPATLTVGINYQASDAFSFNIDMDQTKWSAYDKLEFKDTAGAVLRTITKNYEDVTAIRVGGEYSVDENWTLRAGYLSEPSPVIEETYDPRLPDADATAIFVGGGYDEGKWAVNAAYMALNKDDRTVVSDEPGAPLATVYDGVYKSTVNIIAFDLIYRF